MVRSTNVQWFNFINYDYFTIYFARPCILPSLVKTFSRYAKPIGLCFEKTISIDSSFALLSSLTNLTSLEIEPNLRQAGRCISILKEHTAYFTALTNLQRLNFCRSEVAPYIQHFPKLTALQMIVHNTDPFQPLNFYQYTTEDLQVLSKLGNHTDLKSLNISDLSGFLHIDPEAISKMSQVSKLSYNGPVQFPFNELPNLEILSIRSRAEYDDFSAHSKLTSLAIGCIDNTFRLPVNVAEQLAALRNLKYLEINGQLPEAQYTFLSQLNQLEHLCIKQYTNPSSFLQLVNSPNLTSLHINGFIQSPAYIEHLTSLQQLEYWGADTQFAGSLVKLPNVTQLISSGIGIAEICPNVRKFIVDEVAGVQANDILASLVHLEHLNPSFIDDSLFQVILQHSRLTCLEVWLGNEIDYNFSTLKNLTRLRKLSLYSKFTNDSKTNHLWQAIQTMTDLEELSFGYYSEKLIETTECLPKLKILNVTSSELENVSETKLSNLTDLQCIRWSSGKPFTYRNPSMAKLDLPYLYKFE